jgi:hypothetical protein
MKRVIISGMLGGIALFAWGTLSHMILPLGEVGIKELPNEQAVLSTMQVSIREPGFYLFPGSGLGPEATRDQRMAPMDEIQKKAASGPNGILVFHVGGGGLTAGRLVNEFILNLVQALLAAILLSWAWAAVARSYTTRIAFVTLVGVFGALATNIQYWNWYGFPGSYTAAYIVNQIIGFFVVGLVVAGVLKKQPVPVGAALASA